jgi:hypothetical protein
MKKKKALHEFSPHVFFIPNHRRFTKNLLQRKKRNTQVLLRYFCLSIKNKILQEKAVEATTQKVGKRKKSKPEEHEGMPQRKHCPHAKRRRERNPEWHEEQHR